MRTVAIPVYNNQKIELFVERLNDGFDFMAVGGVDEHRVVIDHHLTHDNLEARLEYARPGDLIWRDAKRSEIPDDKHKHAILQEETIGRGVFWDFENQGPKSVTGHLAALDFLTKDKKELASAKKTLLGKWTDGILTFKLEPNNQLQWKSEDWNHPLNVIEWRCKNAPYWWNFAKWQFSMLNNHHKAATYVGVLQINDKELHLTGGGRANRMAQVFRRI